MKASRLLLALAVSLAGGSASASTLLGDYLFYAQVGPIDIDGGFSISGPGLIGTPGNVNTGTNSTFNGIIAGGNVDTGGGLNITPSSSVLAGGFFDTGTNSTINSVTAGTNVVTGGGLTIRDGSAINAGGNFSTGTNSDLDGADFVLGGTFIQGGGGTAPNSLVTGGTPTAPVITLPTLPTQKITAVSTEALGDVTHGTNSNVTLVPGEYGDLNIGGGSDLHLSAGTYHFSSFNIGTNGKIFYDLTGGEVIVLVDGLANFGGGRDWDLMGTGTAAQVYWETGGNFKAGTNSDIFATIFTSTGIVEIGDLVDIGGGALFAGQIISSGGIKLGTNVRASLVAGEFFSNGNLESGSGPNPVPLPAALPLFATGLGALGLYRWRKRRLQKAA